MPEIILVNPKRRGTRGRKASRTPAQKRATAKLVAMNRARKSGAKVMSNPKRRRRNPAKRTTHRSRSRSVAVHRNPVRRHRRRRNPIGMSGNKPTQLLMPALVGALGATAVNTVLANVGSALPATLMTGNMQYITRAALSVLLAMVGRKSGRANIWTQAAEGSLTVTFHDAIVSLGGGSLGQMGAYMPGRGAQVVPTPGMRPAQQLSGMSAYLTGKGSPQQRQAMAARQAQIASGAKTMRGMRM
jgi:hypothetical protein